MNASTPLPVIMPTIAKQQWSCHSCGNCCRTLVIDLSSQECASLDKYDWENQIGVKPYVRMGRRIMLNKRPDGACVFLDNKNLCMIHARFGEQAKPLACRIFPFSVRKIDGAWQASLRYDCPSATTSKGKPISQHHGWLSQLTRQVSHDEYVQRPNALDRGLLATSDEMSLITNRLSRWVEDEQLSVHQRLMALSRVSSMLFDAKLARVRGKRLGELLDIFWQSATLEVNHPLLAPTKRQLAMLRQVAFVHAEFVTLDELRSGFIGQLRKRWQQLSAARRFLAGKSSVPSLQGITGQCTFDAVDAVIPLPQAKKVDELIQRYLLSRITSQSFFGSGYYGWPLAAGLGALTASVSVIGWLARLNCAARGCNQLQWEDVAQAVAIVDRAATRLPSVGSAAERARIRYLSVEDGLARLCQCYSLTEQTP